MKRLIILAVLLLIPALALAQTTPACTVNSSPDLNLTWDVSQAGADAIMDVMVERQIDSGAWTVMAQLSPPKMYFEAETAPSHFKGHVATYRVRFAYPDGTFGQYSDLACKSFRTRPMNPKAQ